jgi:hypothetical protein
MAGIHLPESDACDSLERGEIYVDWIIQRLIVQGFKCSKTSGSKRSNVLVFKWDDLSLSRLSFVQITIR